MACTAAIEDEIDRHYSEQLDALGDSDPALVRHHRRFQADEREHRDAALAAGAETDFRLSLIVCARSGPAAVSPSSFRKGSEVMRIALLAAAAASPAARLGAAARRRRPGRRSRPSPRIRVNQLIVYGDDPCPQSTDRRDHRLRPAARGRPLPDPAEPARRSQRARPTRAGRTARSSCQYVGRTGTGSCSTVGARRLHRLLRPDRQPGPRRAPRQPATSTGRG